MEQTLMPRLMAAAKEFNIGKNTLLEFLAAQGFEKEHLKPTTRLTAKMYSALVEAFQHDRAMRNQSKEINLSIGD